MYPSDPRAIAGLADAHKFAGHVEEAEPFFERAVELDPEDVLSVLDRAEYWLHRAVRAEGEESQGAFARRALEDSRRARQLAPRNPEALWVCGASQMLLAQPDLDEAIWALEHANSLLPSNRYILLSLLDAYALAGRVTDAERVGEWLISQAHGKAQIEEVEGLVKAASQAARRDARAVERLDGAPGAASCRV